MDLNIFSHTTCNTQIYISFFNYYIISICLNIQAGLGKKWFWMHTSGAQFLEGMMWKNIGIELEDGYLKLVWVGAPRAEKERKLKHCLR